MARSLAFPRLFYVLAWRDLSVRYKQTAIGIIWAVLQPLITTIIFTVIFGRIATYAGRRRALSAPRHGRHAALAIFSSSLTSSSQSLVTNANLISKVYFPRLIVPAGAVITAMVDILITFALLFVLMVWYQFLPTWRFVPIAPFSSPWRSWPRSGPGCFSRRST